MAVDFPGQVYDGEFEAQMYSIFDSNKQLLATGDIYPAATALPKGTYTVRVLVRHDRAELLVKLKAHPLLVDRTLDEPLALPVFATQRGAVTGAQPFTQVCARLVLGF